MVPKVAEFHGYTLEYEQSNLLNSILVGNIFFAMVVWLMFAKTIRDLYKSRRRVSISTIFVALLSYVAIIYLYACGYLTLMIIDQKALVYEGYNEGMDFITALYFSLTTISTVGFGDIHPLSKLSKIIVMSEISLGLTYTVFIFSILAAFVREQR